MSTKRVTIYDLAEALGISVSYISKALNRHPSISEAMKVKVRAKAEELGYIHNSHAANLRRGKSRTMGVIVPHVDKSIFSEAIAGIEEVCAEEGYSLIICQSHESFAQECKAIDLLIRQNVDCIMISVASETCSADYLKQAEQSQIAIVQFDRYLDGLNSFRVVNNDYQTGQKIVDGLAANSYRRIAFLGGPDHMAIYRLREQGYRDAIDRVGLAFDEHLVVRNLLNENLSAEVITNLLSGNQRPDAIVAVADHQALEVLKVATSLGIRVPDELGIIGFANEFFTGLTTPSLSSVDQRSREIGRIAARHFFNSQDDKGGNNLNREEIVETVINWRQSTNRSL